uniref:Rhomboid domain-containing protein n=1 Tax=Heterorhabditis bacteriophora TaxID=37862 RepID=A0A1I7WT05_HETBA
MFIFRSFVLKQQARTLCWTKARLDRFTRDSLRNRLHRQNVRDGTKQRLTQSEHHAPPSAADTIPIRPVRDLIKAIGFTLGIGTAAFSTAAICDYERTRSRLKNVYENTADFFKTKFSSSEDSFRTLWSELTDGDKCALYLVGINFAVFALWKAKGLQVFMWQYFSNSFASSSLSHFSPPVFLDKLVQFHSIFNCRFRLFDHSAHLGGSLFGVFYALWGDDIIWNKFRSLVGKTYRRLKSE